MQINIHRSQKLLLILFMLGMLGGGAALWHATRQPLTSTSRDVAVQTQWRRAMALRMPADETPGASIDKQPFSPIAIPLAGTRLIAWRPQGSGGEMELSLPWQTVPAFFAWLARCGMSPRSFSLYREAPALRLRLQLEAEDDR
ncbi:pilus assembly protein PilO [Klebsiella africana]|mgnify:FL=1|uniref:Pilus assembly protein PilO n=1 Tax=Klebsiella africana TaxID=2489010 RepID=A0ACD4AP44_9ENTR|nr:pilus assembly protein PilO [Klebsiella africana]USB41524.1 pilus assembly protein PilO [Klebsiella africana]